MINIKFSSFTFEAYVFHTVNLLASDIILNITRPEHLKFPYCISVQDY